MTCSTKLELEPAPILELHLHEPTPIEFVMHEDRVEIVSIEEPAVQLTLETVETILLELGEQGPPGRDGAGSGSKSISAMYSTALVNGQIVYLDGGAAHPVSRNMPQAVNKLLAQVMATGDAGEIHDVLLDGLASSAGYQLPSGPVFLGDDGFPTTAEYAERGNYVPLGFGPGGDSFNFAPEGRYFRS